MAMGVASPSLEEWGLFLLFQGNLPPGKAFETISGCRKKTGCPVQCTQGRTVEGES